MQAPGRHLPFGGWAFHLKAELDPSAEWRATTSILLRSAGPGSAHFRSIATQSAMPPFAGRINSRRDEDRRGYAGPDRAIRQSALQGSLAQEPGSQHRQKDPEINEQKPLDPKGYGHGKLAVVEGRRRLKRSCPRGRCPVPCAGRCDQRRLSARNPGGDARRADRRAGRSLCAISPARD